MRKFVNIEHTVVGTFLDEENNVSKKNMKIFYYLPKRLEKNKDLKTVVGHSFIIDENQNRSNGTWSAVYDSHNRAFRVKSTVKDLSIDFHVGKNTKSIVALSSSTTSDSRSKGAAITGHLQHLYSKCTNSSLCNICIRLACNEESGSAWKNCIDKGQKICNNIPNPNASASGCTTGFGCPSPSPSPIYL